MMKEKLLYSYLTASGVCAQIPAKSLDEEDLFVDADLEKDFESCNLVIVSRLGADIRTIKLGNDSYLIWDYGYFSIFFKYLFAYFINSSSEKDKASYIRYVTFELASRFFLEKNQLFLSHIFMGESKKLLDNLQDPIDLKESEKRTSFSGFCKLFIYFHEKCHLLEKWKNVEYQNMEYRTVNFIKFLESSILNDKAVLETILWSSDEHKSAFDENQARKIFLDKLDEILENENKLREVICDYYAIVETIKHFFQKIEFHDLYFFAMCFYSIEMAISAIKNITFSDVDLEKMFMDIRIRNEIRGFMLAKHARIHHAPIRVPQIENSAFWQSFSASAETISKLINSDDLMKLKCDFDRNLKHSDRENLRSLLLAEFGFSKSRNVA